MIELIYYVEKKILVYKNVTIIPGGKRVSSELAANLQPRILSFSHRGRSRMPSRCMFEVATKKGVKTYLIYIRTNQTERSV